MGPVRPCLVSAWSGHNSRRLGVDGDGSPARGRGGGLRAGAAQEGQPARRPCPQECLDKRRLELVAHLPVSPALSPACRGSWTAPRPALPQPASRRSPRLATFSAAEPAVASWRTQTAHLILHPSPQHPPQSRARRPRGAGELGLPGGSWGVPGVLTLGGVGGKAEGPGEGVSNCPGSSRRRHRPSRVGEAGCQAQPNRRRHAKSPTCLPLKRRQRGMSPRGPDRPLDHAGDGIK